MQAGEAPSEHERVGHAQPRALTTGNGAHDAPESSLTASEGQEATRLDSHLLKHTYHGHRRNSFRTKDIDELTELRARRELPFLHFAMKACKWLKHVPLFVLRLISQCRADLRRGVPENCTRYGSLRVHHSQDFLSLIREKSVAFASRCR
jgi:hypothetical protein